MAPTTALFGRRALRDAVATLARRQRALARAASGVAAPSVDGDAGGGADARAASGSARAGSGRGRGGDRAVERGSHGGRRGVGHVARHRRIAGGGLEAGTEAEAALDGRAIEDGAGSSRNSRCTDERRAKIKLALQSLYARRRQFAKERAREGAATGPERGGRADEETERGEF